MNKYIIPLILLLFLFSCLGNLSSNRKEFESKIKELAISLKSTYNNKENKIQRLAVMPFINEGGQRSHLGVFVSNSLQEYVFDTTRFDLLERERIDSILEEHRFNNTGLVSNISMKKLGSLLGADIVILGTISLDHKTFKISSRIVDLQSGSILSISHVDIPSTSSFEDKYKNIITPKAISINGAYELTIHNIDVKDRKRNGQYWDVSPTNPDIYYLVYKNDKLIFPNTQFNAEVVRNRLQATFGHIKSKIVLEEDDILTIVVGDRDHLEDDLIGSLVFAPSKISKIINKTENTFSFDQVEKLVIEIKRIE